MLISESFIPFFLFISVKSVVFSVVAIQHLNVWLNVTQRLVLPDGSDRTRDWWKQFVAECFLWCQPVGLLYSVSSFLDPTADSWRNECCCRMPAISVTSLELCWILNSVVYSCLVFVYCIVIPVHGRGEIPSPKFWMWKLSENFLFV